MVQKTSKKSVTEVCIVEAAAQLFSQRGFKATTTREIAHLAHINEVTLFRYFPRKSDLFWVAAESHLGGVKLGRDLQLNLTEDADPTIVLPKLVKFLLDILTQQPKLIRLLHVATFELPDADKMIREHLGPIFDAVCAYFKRSKERCVISDVEPSLATLSLLGAVTAQHNLGYLLTSDTLDSEKVVAAYAGLFLDGLRPADESAAMPVQRHAAP